MKLKTTAAAIAAAGTMFTAGRLSADKPVGGQSFDCKGHFDRYSDGARINFTWIGWVVPCSVPVGVGCPTIKISRITVGGTEI